MLRNVAFSCESGEVVAILGPSGCGKTSLLRIIAGLVQPSCGIVEGPERLSMVFQENRLLPWSTILENITMFDSSLIPEARAVLTSIGLANQDRRHPHELSGGMQRRVAFGRAFLHTEQLLLMDEPFTGLDPKMRGELQRVVLDLWSKSRPAIVFVTHDVDDALVLADRIILMNPVDPCRDSQTIDVDLGLARESRTETSWYQEERTRLLSLMMESTASLPNEDS